MARRTDFEGKRTVQTLHGFDKPLLNGYRALARLGSERVSCRVEPAGEHLSAIAAREGTRQIGVLVTHFRPDQPASQAPAQPVRLRLETAWPDGTRAELRHWRIDAAHSNAYSVFTRLGRPKEPSAGQIAEIKRQMGLAQLAPARRVVVRGPVEVPLFELPCNGVSLVELVKLD